MTLDFQTTYPSARSYVLKLHRDALPRYAQISGRLENMHSGRQFEFNNADELLACLTADMTSTAIQPKE